jgi:hypothetical protein
MYKEIKNALDSIDYDLAYFHDFQSRQLKYINKIEHLKRNAVKSAKDDVALEHTNQLIQLRKDYAYTSGMIDGLKYAERVILHCLGEEI